MLTLPYYPSSDPPLIYRLNTKCFAVYPELEHNMSFDRYFDKAGGRIQTMLIIIIRASQSEQH